MASALLLHIGTLDGIFVASKPGTSPEWHITKHLLEGRPVAALALGATIPVRLLAAVPSMGLLHSTTGGRAWMLSLPLDVLALLPDPAEPDRVYAALGSRDAPASAPGVPPVPAPGSLVVSEDGGQTWAPLPALPATEARVLSLARTGDGRLWAGLAAGGVLYKEADGGWQGLLGLDGQEPVRALAVVGPLADELIAATPSGLYALATGQRPDDGAWKGSDRAWRALAGPPPSDVRHLLAVGRLVGGSLPPALLAVDGAGRLQRSEDGGATWGSVALPMPAVTRGAEVAVTALAPHPEYPDRAYAATESGHIYETRNRGLAWEDTGLTPGPAVLSLGVVAIK